MGKCAAQTYGLHMLEEQSDFLSSYTEPFPSSWQRPVWRFDLLRWAIIAFEKTDREALLATGSQ